MLPAASLNNEQLVNVVSFERGAVLLDFSSDYGGRSAAKWIALGLVDGTPVLGWVSQKHGPLSSRLSVRTGAPLRNTCAGFR